jgi:hypothetical protein
MRDALLPERYAMAIISAIHLQRWNLLATQTATLPAVWQATFQPDAL